MKIAQERSRIRHLGNIIWVRSWIEGIRVLGLGAVDQIQSSGVLHHLKNVAYGLKLIKDILAPNGGVSIMVYGKYGRTAIYQMQHIMKIIRNGSSDINADVRMANKTLNSLPQDHWFDFKFISRQPVAVEIYDRILHKRDACFSISKLFRWLNTSGFYFVVSQV